MNVIDNKVNNKTKLCCVLDQAAHYRKAIYHLIDSHFDAHFYITRWKIDPFKQINYTDLIGFKEQSQNKRIIGNFIFQRNTIRLVFKNYDHYLMIGNPFSISTWIMIIMIRILNKKCYLWSHGWYGDENFLKLIIKYIFFSLSNITFLYGDHAKKLMINHGISSQKLICIYNSLDYNTHISIRNILRPCNIYKDYFGNENPVLIFIGRLRKVKKIDLLIRAIRLLKSEGYFCNLILIGKDSKDVDIKALVLSHEIEENTWLYGPSYDEETIGKLIFNADLCVSPGNVGLTAIHSLSFGTPVLTHDNFSNQMPEFEAIIDGETGTFFRENSVTDMALKIKTWTKLSAEKRANIRNSCYKIIDEKYNPGNQIKILINAIC